MKKAHSFGFQVSSFKFQVISHAESAESADYLFINAIVQIVRINYRFLWLIFNSITQTGLDDSIAHHP